MLKIISSFIVCLPEFVKLFRELQKQIDEAQSRKKVVDDIKKINEAFRQKDSNALRAIFNNTHDNSSQRLRKS